MTGRWLIRVLLAAALSAVCAGAQAQPSEAQVKAAFLMKFAPFVSWPAGAARAPLLCLQGDDAVIDTLASAGEANLAVRRMSLVEPDAGCTILYAAGSARQSTGAALAAVRAAPVLTVTDSRNGEVRGMIHFVVVDERVRFHIDQRAALRSRLSISSKLLALALTVKS